MFGMIVVGVIVIVGATVALIGYPSPRPAAVSRKTAVASTAESEGLGQPVQAAPVRAVPPAHVPRAIEKPRQRPVVETRNPSEDSAPAPRASVAATTVSGNSASETVGPERSSGAPVASSSTPDAARQAVTISGCLEMTLDEEQFRLADTEGADAPKSRSWRSGFFKKQSAAVELVNLSDVVGMRKLVGQRVVATGLLTDKQMVVRSLHAAGSSCD